MASVTSVKASEVLALENSSIVSAVVNQSTKKLMLVRGDGTQIDAGIVIPTVPAPPPAHTAFGIGAIYMTISPNNPATILGGGTWVRWGQGRVVVSLDEGQPEFDTVEETGGAKTHTLSLNELPSHNHGGVTGGRSTDHAHGQIVLANGRSANPGDGANIVRENYGGDRVGSLAYPSGAYTGGETVDHNHYIYAEGGGQAHNNLQPYITCYMWKKTAN